MKKLAFLLLIFVPNLLSGQSKSHPKFLLNSQIISFDSVFIYPKNIDSVYVNKDGSDGQIFIRTKDRVWKYRTIDELLKEKGEHFKEEVERSILCVQIGELGNLVHQLLRTVDGISKTQSAGHSLTAPPFLMLTTWVSPRSL